MRRVLEAKVRMGVFEKPLVDEAGPPRCWPTRPTATSPPRGRALFLCCCGEKQLLPQGSSLQVVAVIGPLADSAVDTVGPWIFAQNDAETVTVLAGLKAKLGNKVKVDYSPGRQHAQTGQQIHLPRAQARDGGRRQGNRPRRADGKQSDVAVLVLGEAQIMSGRTPRAPASTCLAASKNCSPP